MLRKAGREQLPDPVEEALRRPVATGVSVAPLYTAADVVDLPPTRAPGLPPFVRGSRVVRPAPSAADGAGGDVDPGGLGRAAAARRPRRRDDERTRSAPTSSTA